MPWLLMVYNHISTFTFTPQALQVIFQTMTQIMTGRKSLNVKAVCCLSLRLVYISWVLIRSYFSGKNILLETINNHSCKQYQLTVNCVFVNLNGYLTLMHT